MFASTTVDRLPATLPEDLVLLDVREPEEWVHGHVEGAVHVPLAQLPVRLPELPEGPVLVICKVGGRSAQASMWLAQQGREVTNLEGGMLDWEAAGRPMVSETGHAPQVV